jgi:cytochrome c-type protein NapC
MHKTLMAFPMAITAAVAATAPALAAPDWSKAPARKAVLFFPGTSSMEWVLRGVEHGGAKAVKKNETCASCHDQEAADIGKKIVSGEKKELEATPVKKPGSIPVTIQAAYDASNLYVRVQWKDTGSNSGKKMDAQNAVKAAMMMDAGEVKWGVESGCWASCHHDLRSMPDVDANAAKNALAKKLGVQSDGPTKYLEESRTAISGKDKPRGGWDKLKPDAEVDAALKAGKFLDIVQYRSGAGARDGYVLDARRMKDVAGAAEGGKNGDTWTVTFKRPLAGGEGDHKIAAGKTYNVGFAIHDDHADARYHHVSVNYTLALDNPKADINAVKQ